ncbi:hypothetical protein [Zavarzinella formosa]|uniref:hypothetical protein n=1 Tax=Zavarzinella formosa TaxID=360055 RepID=UPI0003007951|nr:hypothetical protein [Zavarzinella formosa]
MSRFLWCVVACALTTAAMAQQNPGLPLPRLEVVSPPGAKAGTTVAEVTFTGTDLEETESLIFGHPGITGTVIIPPDPKADPKVDPKTPKMPAPPRRKGGGTPTAVKFSVSVAANVPVGHYDVRAVNKYGVSNPRTFVVGDLPEVAEKEPNNDVPEAMKIELNTTVNGTFGAPADVDLFIITAKKGQRIVLACMAAVLDSKARPLVEVYDQTNRKLATQNGPDAVTDFIAPADGEYFVRVAEFTYTAGSPQHFYRLTVTTNPWIDAVFPPMVEPGKPTPVTLYGRNLPGGQPDPGTLINGRPVDKLVVTVNAPNTPDKLTFLGRIDPRVAGADGFEYRLTTPTGSSNPVLIAFAQDKVVIEKEPNDKPEQAMDVPAPCEIAGRVDKRSDRDYYAINAKKGETYLVDLWSDRLGVDTDFLFTVRGPKATTDMMEKDDTVETLSTTQFYTRSSDPEPYKFTATEDGKYLVQVASRESSFLFGPHVSYRLRITPEKPDFRLVVMPSSKSQPDVTVLRADGAQYLDVFVFRQDGFTGPVTLTAEGLPAGVTAPPQVVGNGQKAGTLVLLAAPTAATFNGTFVVKGTAAINGKQVVHDARPATIVWGMQQQNNTPTITRMDQAVMLAVRDKSYFKVTLQPENAFVKMGEKLPQPLTAKPGEKITVPFTVTRISPDAKVAINLQQIVTGANPQAMPVTANNGQALPAIAPDKGDGTMVLDVKSTALPGTYCVVLKATATIQYDKDPMGKAKKPVTVETASTPLVLKVLPLSLAKVTAVPAGALKAGMTAELVVKVERQFDYAGDFKVKIVLPPNTKGITVDDVTIPAGATEVKAILKAAIDVPAANLQSIVVTATGTYDGIAIPQDGKFNLNVEKAPPPPVKKEEPKKPEPKKEEPKKK